MFTISIWCHHQARRQQIHTYVYRFEHYEVIEDASLCDILFIDITDEAYRLEIITPIIKEYKNCIIVILASDASSLLDIVGLSIYQYILHEQLDSKLMPCLEAIQAYLTNISTLCIHVNREHIFVKVHAIYYFRFLESFVYVGLEDKEYPTQYTSLEKVKAKVGDDFLYCNRNTLVHIPYISSMSEKEISLGTYIFPLSRRRKSTLLKRCAKKRWQK